MSTPTEIAPLQLLHVHDEISISAPPSVVFDALLDQLGPASDMMDGSPFPMKLQPWPGGRWYRDLGHNSGHLWGHVQVIKPPNLLEITGPLCMSYAATGHLQYRITERGGGSHLAVTYRAFGEITAEHRHGMPLGFAHDLKRVREMAEARVGEESVDRQFLITRTFDAPRNTVFRSWTDPRLVAQWWGPKGFTNPVCQLDVRVGGAYRIVMRGPDGVEYPVKGVYHEVVEPERLVMTDDCSEHPEEWHELVNPSRRPGDERPALESLATVTFEDIGGKTKLTLRSLFETPAIRDAMLKMGMTDGWSESLDRLGDLLAKAQFSQDLS